MRANELLNGRFRLLKNIGRGGQGTVWLAEDTVLEREVALKHLVEPQNRVPLRRQREYAMREAQALARVNHRNVVTIHDVFVVNQDPWLVMRYVLGKPLSEILAAGPLNEREVAAVALQVVHGLSAAHRRDVLHRDVKPENILVTDDDEIVLVDFGTAHVRDAPSLTDPQFLMCTPEFTAPERFGTRNGAGQDLGAAADLWSLGITMFFAIEGYSPFRRGGDRAALVTMNAVLGDKLPVPRRAGRLTGLITGLLEKDPTRRIDAAGVERVLTAILHGVPHVQVPLSRPPVRPESPRQPAPPDRSRLATAVALGRISELGDGAAVAWLLTQTTGEAAATLLDIKDSRRDRIFRQIAEARPDVAAEILVAWRGDIAGQALRQLRQQPPLVARMLSAIRQRSPDGDPVDAVRVIRNMNDPVGLAAAFGYLPQPLAIALLDQMPNDQAVTVLEKMDPATVREMRSASPEVLGRLLRTVRSGFLTQVNRDAPR